MRKKLGGIALSILILTLSSCSDNTVFEAKKDFKNGYWAWHDPVIFDFEIEDTTAKYNIDYFIRNSIDYKNYNIYLKHYLEDSSGSVISTKLNNVLLFDPKSGKPLGNGMGDIFNIEKTFLKDFTFPAPGKYKLRVDQFMRIDTLSNIQALGISISKVKQQE